MLEATVAMCDQSGTEAGLLWILELTVFRDSFRVEFVAKFLAVKTKTKISGLSQDFFYYGREWLFYVKCFFVCYCWQFNNMLNMCQIF